MILHRIGHTPEKHNGIFDLYALTSHLVREHGEAFITNLQQIYTAGMLQLIEDASQSREKSLNPTFLLIKARKALGHKGMKAMLEMIETNERVRRLSPHSGGRWVEWKDVIPLDGLFPRSSDKAAHGEFIDQRMIDFLSANSDQIFNMHRRKFDELVAEYFHRQGCRVELGPLNNDDGIDIRVWTSQLSDAVASQLHLIQCKRQRAKVEKIVVKGLYSMSNLKVQTWACW